MPVIEHLTYQVRQHSGAEHQRDSMFLTLDGILGGIEFETYGKNTAKP